MSRFAAQAALLIAGTATAVLAAPASAQTSHKPLGQMLDPLPVRETQVERVDLPASQADGYELINPEDYPEDDTVADNARPAGTAADEAEIARRQAELAQLRAAHRGKVDAVEAPITARLNEAEAARAANAAQSVRNSAEAPVTAGLNEAEAARTTVGRPGSGVVIDSYERELAAAAERAKLDAVEAPVTAQLNNREAVRAYDDRRRYEDERVTYERDLAWREQQADADRIAYWNRVERDRAEYRARVRACRSGDRYACGNGYGYGLPVYGRYYGTPVNGRPFYGRY